MAKRQGFTLIELLVVVVIIGILASVALPSFVGAQDKARNSAMASNIKSVKLALEQYATDNKGSYPEPGGKYTVALAGGGGGRSRGGGGAKKKKGCGEDCLDGLEEYLPGDALPRSPWSTVGSEVFALVDNSLANAKEVVEGTDPLTPVNTVISDKGKIVTGGQAPDAMDEYGAIAYSYNPASTIYTLYGTGKKGRQAIVAAAESNGGQ